MKQNLHPTYYSEAKVKCACGQAWATGSTLPEINTEICSNCHPYFTGKQKLIDTTGNVDRFTRRQSTAAEKKAVVTTKKPRKARTTTTATIVK